MRDERAVGEIKAQGQRRRLSNPYARGSYKRAALFPELSERRVSCDKQRRASVAKVACSQRGVDPHALTQLRRAIRQRRARRNSPTSAHDGFTEQWLNRTDKHRLRDPSRPANRIHTKVTTIDEIDIGIARRSEHDTVAAGRPNRCMAGGIVGQIGFNFHYGPAANSFWAGAKQPVAKQPARDHIGRRLVK